MTLMMNPSRYSCQFYKYPQSKRAFAGCTTADNEFINDLADMGLTPREALSRFDYFSEEILFIFKHWFAWGFSDTKIKDILTFKAKAPKKVAVKVEDVVLPRRQSGLSSMSFIV